MAMTRTKTHAASAESVAAATPFTNRLEHRVLQFIRRRSVVPDGERAIVAVSGGPDSTAMLIVLARLSNRLKLDLTVAHFDHMLRSPEDAAEDEAFVRRLAQQLKLPLTCGRGDVRLRVRRTRESVEDAARRLRYTFLGRGAKAAGASVVLLGHTEDDQAESVLLHILRGSGLDGLRGMRARSRWPLGQGPDVARPLLELSRGETARYCQELGLQPRQDPTNELIIATRNRVRHELLPKLREFNPRAERALARLADAVAQDAEYLDLAAEEAWDRLSTKERDHVSFLRAELQVLHPALTSRLLRRAFEHLLGTGADLEAVHIGGIAIALKKPRSRLSLPHSVTATLDARSLTIRRGASRRPSIPETRLVMPGTTRAGEWRIEAGLVPVPSVPPTAGRLEALLDADAVGGNLVVRSRRPGDRLRPLGLGGEKKVQDILVDAKVPACERDGVPILCSGGGIVWVMGHRIDENAAITSATRRCLRVRFSRGTSS